MKKKLIMALALIALAEQSSVRATGAYYGAPTPYNYGSTYANTSCCPPRCCRKRIYGRPRWTCCPRGLFNGWSLFGSWGGCCRPKRVCCPSIRCCRPPAPCCPAPVPACPAAGCVQPTCSASYSQPVAAGTTASATTYPSSSVSYETSGEVYDQSGATYQHGTVYDQGQSGATYQHGTVYDQSQSGVEYGQHDAVSQEFVG